MRITILTYGSRGDVQPFLAMAVGLQKAGYQVKLVAPHRFESFVSAYGIPFIPLAGDPEIISQRLNSAGSNPVGMIRAISDYIFSIADQVALQAFAACDDADLIIHSFLFTVGGHSLARKLGIPDISVQTFPVFAPTRTIPPVSMPNLPPGLLSYFFHWLTMQIFWHGGNLGFKRLRKASPQLFDLDLYWPFHVDESRITTPLVLACSPMVIPRPPDWSAPYIHTPGYFFLVTPPEYQPPEILTDFLADGTPPVCVTFGSTVHSNPKKVYNTVLDALSKTNNRVVILGGWSDLRRIPMPDNALVMDAVPHDWLLPRCKTVIHHGGAGTTAAGLRSGIPNLVISSASDQPFWGARVHAISAGPQPIPVKRLTTEKLITALTVADDVAIRNSAQAVGKKISSEDGVGELVNLVGEWVKNWQ
jgi:UDP:flavonoid glycosyltransferase YjiC (YdhE family)